MTETHQDTTPDSEHAIDCSLLPSDLEGVLKILPEKYQIASRFKNVLKWNKEKQKSALYFSQKQMSGEKWIDGEELMKEIIDKSLPVLPANVLDYLLQHKDLIPDSS